MLAPQQRTRPGGLPRPTHVLPMRMAASIPVTLTGAHIGDKALSRQRRCQGQRKSAARSMEGGRGRRHGRSQKGSRGDVLAWCGGNWAAQHASQIASIGGGGEGDCMTSGGTATKARHWGGAHAEGGGNLTGGEARREGCTPPGGGCTRSLGVRQGEGGQCAAAKPGVAGAQGQRHKGKAVQGEEERKNGRDAGGTRAAVELVAPPLERCCPTRMSGQQGREGGMMRRGFMRAHAAAGLSGSLGELG